MYTDGCGLYGRALALRQCTSIRMTIISYTIQSNFTEDISIFDQYYLRSDTIHHI